MEGLGTPLRALQHAAGNPTQAVIAEKTELSEGTVGNVLNGRHLIKCEHVVAIADYLGGEAEDWVQRWVDTSSRLAAQRTGTPSPEPPKFESSAPQVRTDQAERAESLSPPTSGQAAAHAQPDAVRMPLPRHNPGSLSAPELPDGLTVRSRRRTIGVVVVGVAALVGLLAALVLHGGSKTAPRAQPATPSVRPPTSPASSGVPVLDANARQEPVPGRPTYKQCNKAARSILSEPGKDRGGEPRGMIKPGELFVVTAKTRYWKYGQVVGDPSRRGWVMSVNLCAVLGQTPSP